MKEEYIRKVIQALKRCPVKTWSDIGDEDATEKDIEDIQVKFIQDTLGFFKEDNDEEDTMVSLDDVHDFLLDNMYTEMDEGDYSYGNYEINWRDWEDRKNPNPLSKFLDLLDEAVVKK